MRWRRFIGPASVVIAVVAVLWWWQGGSRRSHSPTTRDFAKAAVDPVSNSMARTSSAIKAAEIAKTQPGFHFLSQPTPEAPDPVSKKPSDRFKYRLTNTPKPIGDLVHNRKAILLENALFDTTASFDQLNIPAALAASGDPGAYIVQAKSDLDDGFRWQIRQLGARIVSYIPNNAYLVRASQDAAGQIASLPQTQTVLPYEPYYKLKSSLLPMAVENLPLPDGRDLNLLVFPDAQESTMAALSDMNITVLGQERSPFGQIVRVQPPSRGWTDLARLQGVQVVEMARPRTRANDLSRVRVGVATDSTTTTNYLNLTGTNVLVNVNDTGVDAQHPDLINRVFSDFPSSGTDTNGHGTHVAGIIASTGRTYQDITNASGSVMPPTNGQFRGIAPGANIFAMSIDSVFGIGGSENSFGPLISDQYLQETAARTNALISNNSWHYANDNEYDLAAASYDAAVRDALPQVTGSSPITYVFAAGNAGGGDDNGGSGSAGTVNSPATAKNVITVGTIEQARNITNQTWICRPDATSTNSDGMTCSTNTPWMNMTDSSNQVASFSSRGNVGVEVEGSFGRFKPDLVAPGTFVVSTTEKDHWDQVSYYNPTNYHFDTIPDQQLETNNFIGYAIFVPYNAVQMVLRTFSSDDLRIYVKYPGPASPTNYDIVGTNIVSLPPAAALVPTEATWSYAVENISDHTVSYLVETELVTTNDLGNYLQVLSNLNLSLGPYYRYESGTSMSAADISGMVALVKEYFEQPPQSYTHPAHTNSPALMKALLINGARSVGAQYDFGIYRKINFQGWGLPNLTTTIPTNTDAFSDRPKGSILFFDQDPTNALATGQSRSYHLSVSPDANANPLRVTLVWTDPPGNPVASIKLVNDLDLVVSNNVTGDIFYGNDIAPGNTVTFPTDTNAPPNLDVINNVENVFISNDVATNYTIYVVGRHVNVNAVTAHPNDVVQDYALVISSGDGEVSNALQIVDVPITTFTNTPFITEVTNSFASDPNSFGGMLLNQHAGANSPLLGTNTLPLPKYQGQLTIGETNQWHFYAISNGGGADFTNAAFLTFLPPTLSVPRMGVDQSDPNNASRFEGDLDLYVSTDPTITNLNPAAIDASYKSLSRGGSETVVISNAVPGTIYYIGVKSEDHEAAEYGFLGVFSNLPFGSQDANGDMHLRGFPAPAPIPDGSPDVPGGVYVFAVCSGDLTVKRVLATNIVSHEQVNDLFAKLTHGAAEDVLQNHSGSGPTTNRVYIYNDSGQTVTGSQHSDGPGTLRNFAAQPGAGQWMLTMIDNSPGHTGTNMAFSLFLEKQQDLVDGITLNLNGGECDEEFIYVPIEATNLTVIASILSGGGPAGVRMTVCPLDASGSDCQTTVITGINSTNTIVIDKHSTPPLNPGWYSVRICNLDQTTPVTVRIRATLGLDLTGIQPTVYAAGGPTPILDDAVTTSSILVTNKEKLVSVEVGVRIDHPRVSDLALTLVGPDGTRVLLDENRGGFTTNGLGLDQFATNIIPVNSAGGPDAVTNTIDTGLTSGTLQIDYNFFTVPDRMTVYYQGTLLWDSGMIGGAGTQTITFGPGASTVVTIIMNQGGNTNSTTKWEYTVTSTTAHFYYATFTEDTNKTVTPVKFAIPPFLPQFVSIQHWANGFEDADAGVYAASTSSNAFGNSWHVDLGSVTILTNGYGPGAAAYEGDQFLQLSGDTGRAGTVSTNVGTVPGRDYVLSFAYAANPSSSNAQTATLFIDNISHPISVGLGSNTWDNLNWGIASFGFRAASNSTFIQFAGDPSATTNGLLIDYVTMRETSTNLFLLPEDPFGLNHFKKMPALGNWTLEVWDNRVGAYPTDPPPTLRSWALSLLFETPIPEPIDLIDNNPSTNVLSGYGVQYFRVAVPTWASFATNALLSASGNVDVWFNQNGKPLNGIGTDYLLLGNSTGGSVTLQTNAVPPPLPPLIRGSTYTIAVSNTTASAVTFAFQVNFDVTPLTLNVPVSDTEFTNTVPRFFSYDVTTNETGISVQLTNVSGNVDLVARQTPFPDLGRFDYGSFNPGASDEDIIIYTNSDIPLMPGRWYFGVFNRDATNVDYTIVVTDITGPVPGIIDLTNGIPYANTNSGTGIPNDYYHYAVTNPVARAQFEINSPSADMTLVVRRSLPPPDLGQHDYISANPGTNDELIVLHPWSSPVPLTAGDWYLTAVNVSGGPATYSIKATQWIDAGTNIVITNFVFSGSSFCVTWTSLPGVHYVVQGKVNLNDPAWQDASPTITATNYSSTWCVTPWPSPFHFFRVREGLANTGAVMPIPPSGFTLSRGTNSSNFVLNWTGPVNAKYEVQWSPTLNPPAWSRFSNIVTSPNGAFFFKDDGTQSGGLGAARFYRLQQMP